MVTSVERDFSAWGRVASFREFEDAGTARRLAPRPNLPDGAGVGPASRRIGSVTERNARILGAAAAIALGVVLWIEVFLVSSTPVAFGCAGLAMALFAGGMHLMERAGIAGSDQSSRSA